MQLTAPAPQTAEQIRREINRPGLPAALAVALIRDPERCSKPVAFPTVAQLAAAMHRERQGAAIELQDAPLMLSGERRKRDGVSVWTLADGQRRRYLGWAWIDGAGREVLARALFALQPNPAH